MLDDLHSIFPNNHGHGGLEDDDVDVEDPEANDVRQDGMKGSTMLAGSNLFSISTRADSTGANLFSNLHRGKLVLNLHRGKLVLNLHRGKLVLNLH